MQTATIPPMLRHDKPPHLPLFRFRFFSLSSKAE